MADEIAGEIRASDTATAASDEAGKPQLDMEKITLDQLDTLMTKGEAELPHVVVSGEEEPSDKKDATPPAKAEPEGEQPPAEKVEGEVAEETRTAEEIETAQTEARERVKADGGDEAAQEAAAEEAGKPVVAAAEEVVEEEDKSPETIQRPRLKDQRDQLIAGVYMKAKRDFEAGKIDAPLTWAESEARIDGPKAETRKVEIVDPTAELAANITTLETELKALETQVDEKAAVEGTFDAEAAKLMRALSAKETELTLARERLTNAKDKMARDTEAEFRAESDANRSEAHATAIAEFPDVADKTTKLGKAVSDRIAKLKDPKHPDHELLKTDSAPLFITRVVAAELGIAPKKANSSPAKPQTKVVAPPKKVVPPASGAKTSVPAQSQSPEDAKKKTVEYYRTDAPLEELDALFGIGSKENLLAGAIR